MTSLDFEKLLDDTLKPPGYRSNKNENDQFTMTPEEAKKFEHAFESPEFHKLMTDYIKEISDPKARAEQDEYIRQLEEKAEVPAGKTLIRPKPNGFVVKFRFRKVQKAQNNDEYPEKIFANVVSSDYIQEPSFERAKERDGTSNQTQPGQNCKLPYAVGPSPRMEQDKSKSLVATFDICFHPNAIRMSHSNRNFQHLIAKTCLEAIEYQWKNTQKEKIQTNPNYVILKGIKYKTGTPSAMIINSNPQLNQNSNKDERSYSRGGHLEKSVKKGFLHGQNSHKMIQEIHPPKPKSENLCLHQNKQVNIPARTSNIEVPDYSITESCDFDLSEHTLDTRTKLTSSPQNVVIRIGLPKVKSPSEINLDVDDEKFLKLSSMKGHNHNYNLVLKLQHSVENRLSKAKWNKKKQELELRIPVSGKDVSIDSKTEQQLVNGKRATPKKEEILPQSVEKDEYQNKSIFPQSSDSKHLDHSRWVQSDDCRDTLRKSFAFRGEIPMRTQGPSNKVAGNCKPIECKRHIADEENDFEAHDSVLCSDQCSDTFHYDEKTVTNGDSTRPELEFKSIDSLEID